MVRAVFAELRRSWLTATVAAAALAVHFVPGLRELMQLDRQALEAGELWRLWTAQLSHWSNPHLWWDLSTFAVLGTVCERESRVRAAICLLISLTCIPLLIYGLAQGVESFRGLSGVDCALFALAAGGYAGDRRRRVRSAARWALALLVAKASYEAFSGQALFVGDAAATPIPLAHALGAIVGILCALLPVPGGVPSAGAIRGRSLPNDDPRARNRRGGRRMTQMGLLNERRFGPFFWTQFLGALNDNVFKNALAILVIFHSLSIAGLEPQEVVVLSAGVFILPFVLFSATAGQLADRCRKPTVMRWTKLAEIVLMAIAALGLARGDLGLLLVVLFLMGAQSSFFGPVKYSILPQLLHRDELVGGNALVETGTFLAILFGTILGGVLVSVPDTGVLLVGAAVVGLAVAGFLTSLRVPDLPAENPGLRISLNPVTPLRETARVTRANRAVFLSILGISWFWFYGSCFLALLPDYGKSVLHGGEHVVTLLLALFCVGTAIGSLLCDRLSGHKIELGLVPIGSIGMTIAGFDLFLVGKPPVTTAELLSAGQFVAQPGSWRVMADFVLIALFGGLFIVPLYAMVQQRSEAAYRSRVIAGSNILGAFFMVASSLMLMALLRVGLSLPQIFAVLALMNVAVAVYIYQVIPEFLLRFVAWVVANVMYRMRVIGLENIPKDGPALLVCNHVSFVDWLIIASACDRPPRFVMYHGFAKSKFAGWFFRDAKVIPIAPAHESRETLDGAFDRIAAELEDGNLVCIFPEGKLTKDGELNPFRTGVERIVARTPVPVIPMALKGMWGSYFSRKDGAALKRPFRRVWSRISLVIGPAMPPEEADALSLSRRVARLADMTPPPNADLGPAVVNN